MPNSKKSLRLPADDRREQIVRVARLHFAREGYDLASMSRIAEEAGVTRALVYHYFSGKAALLDAVMHSESDELLAATAPDPSRTPIENIRSALHAYFDHFSPDTGTRLNIHLQADRVPGLAGALTETNHAIQVKRVVSSLALPDSATTRVVIAAWLAFVQKTAMLSAEHSAIDPSLLVTVCLDALQAATRHLLSDEPITVTPHRSKSRSR